MFIIVIGISVFNAIYSSVFIGRSQDITNEIMTNDIPSLQALEDLNSLITRSKMHCTNWVYLSNNRDDKEKLRTILTFDYPEKKGVLQALMSRWEDKSSVDSLTKILHSYEAQVGNQRRVMRTLAFNSDYDDPIKVYSAEEILAGEVIPECNKINASLNQLILKKKDKAEKRHAVMQSSSRIMLWSLLALAILVVVVVLIAAFYMSNSIIVPTMKLKNYILQMGKGEIPQISIKIRDTAIGQMAGAVAMLRDNLSRTIGFAKDIGSGNLEVDYQPLGEKDALGNALLSMRENLRKAHLENTQRHWISAGLANLNEVLRNNHNDIATLSDDVIRALVLYVNACQGGLYLLEKNEHGGKQIINLQGSYAKDFQSDAQLSIRPGEGLVGQAVKDGKVIHLSGAPENYLKIKSALGEAAASHLLIIPLIHRGEIYGAMELASFRPFSDIELSFLEKSSDAMASTISSVKNNMLTRQLLSETRKQADRLVAQEEELRQTNEELSSQSQLLQTSEEELKQSNLELEFKARELSQQNEILEQAREALALKAQELEVNNRYKSEFLANMSHELRTPLNSIMILAKLLADNPESNLSEKQSEYAKVIHKSGNDLLILINDILDLSKVEAGKIDLVMEDVNIRDVKDDMMNLFAELANEKKIEFETEIHSEIPETMTTDRIRLEQILKNLLSNAFKFTPEGGKVVFRISSPVRKSRYSTPALIRSRRLVEFSVHDNGIGIPKEKFQVIFDAFQQVDGSTSRKYGGTGLGLSICKMLVSLLGGEIRLESESGKGSSFYVCLPISTNETESSQMKISLGGTEVSTQGQDSSSSNAKFNSSILNEAFDVSDDPSSFGEGEKVLLLLEEDPTIAQTLADMAHEKNYKVLHATQSDDGLRMLEANKPHAIIMDMHAQGLDLLQKIRKNPEWNHIPIHVLSPRNRGNLALDLGATACLSKPLDAQDLKSVFTQLDQGQMSSTQNVLIIDDSQVDSQSIRNLLHSRNVSLVIHTAEDSDKALQLLSSINFDCILLNLDIQRSRQTGLTLLEQIRGIERYQHTPLIVYTNENVNADEELNLEVLSNAIVINNGQIEDRIVSETQLFLSRVCESRRSHNSIPEKLQNVLLDKTVLIVDDDVRNIYALTGILEHHGLNVISAINGEEALSRLVRHPEIDLVLMDIMMPKLDGYETMRIIREDMNLTQVPIIALTAKAMQGDREKCIQYGASDYLVKPISIEKLIALMKIWLYV